MQIETRAVMWTEHPPPQFMETAIQQWLGAYQSNNLRSSVDDMLQWLLRIGVRELEDELEVCRIAVELLLDDHTRTHPALGLQTAQKWEFRKIPGSYSGLLV